MPKFKQQKEEIEMQFLYRNILLETGTKIHLTITPQDSSRKKKKKRIEKMYTRT